MLSKYIWGALNSKQWFDITEDCSSANDESAGSVGTLTPQVPVGTHRKGRGTGALGHEEGYASGTNWTRQVQWGFSTCVAVAVRGVLCQAEFCEPDVP